MIFSAAVKLWSFTTIIYFVEFYENKNVTNTPELINNAPVPI